MDFSLRSLCSLWLKTGLIHRLGDLAGTACRSSGKAARQRSPTAESIGRQRRVTVLFWRRTASSEANLFFREKWRKTAFLQEHGIAAFFKPESSNRLKVKIMRLKMNAIGA